MKKGLAVLSLCVASGLSITNVNAGNQEVCGIAKLGAGHAILMKQQGKSMSQAMTSQNKTIKNMLSSNASEASVTQISNLWSGFLQSAYKLPTVKGKKAKEIQFQKFMKQVDSLCSQL